MVFLLAMPEAQLQDATMPRTRADKRIDDATAAAVRQAATR
jgi:hypothetical protein